MAITRRTLCSFAALCISCGGSSQSQQPAPPQPPPPPQRTAAEADNLRVMLAEIAALKACERAQGTFRGLSGGPEAGTTGTLWLDGCTATQDGKDMTLQLSGKGWRWLQRSPEKVGADFEVSQYGRFAVTVTVRGTMDIAYAPDSHIATLWFTPEGAPEVSFQSIGDVAVDKEGLWATVVAGAASLFATSPDEKADQKLESEGREKFEKRFAKGYAVTLDLCTGELATGFGHPPAGEMVGKPSEGPAVEATLHRDGVLLSGPHDRKQPLEVVANMKTSGGIQLQVVCEEDATQVAQAMLDGRALPVVKPIASAKLIGSKTLTVPPGGCSVVVLTRPLAGNERSVSYSYQAKPAKPDSQPLATCPAEQ